MAIYTAIFDDDDYRDVACRHRDGYYGIYAPAMAIERDIITACRHYHLIASHLRPGRCIGLSHRGFPDLK